MTNLLADVVRQQAVWAKGTPIPGYDPTEYRRDAYGAVMRYFEYGNRNSEYGWEIDHHIPDALGGSDAFGNLRPLHWRNNASLGGALTGLLSGRR